MNIDELMKNQIIILGEVRKYLPDTEEFPHDPSWGFAWDCLSDKAQEDVKVVRREISKLVKKMEEIID